MEGPVQRALDTEAEPAARERPRTPVRWLYAAAGLVAVALGAIGIVLPLLPTTPLVLLAGFCFARSSPRMHRWLLDHRLFGPMLRDWHANGAIRPRAKALATVLLLGVMATSLALARPAWWVWAVCALCAAGVLGFIWSRPDG